MFRRLLHLLCERDTIRVAVEEMHPRTGHHPTYGPIGWWATGKVTDMYRLFYSQEQFNADLGGWDVSNVVTMNSMFAKATSFKGSGLDKWQCSEQLQDMSGMFAGATQFNADLSRWDVSNVTLMYRMFEGATQFNGDLSQWDVSNVQNATAMFKNATAFEGRGMHQWRPSDDLRHTSKMFENARRFDADVGEWNVSKVWNMRRMFRSAVAFKGTGLDRWAPLTSLKYAGEMFAGATQFNADLSGWDFSNVEEMKGMFVNTAAFTGRVPKGYSASR